MWTELLILDPNDWVPNNPRLPVLIYRTIASGNCNELAENFETRFSIHGWSPKWRDTIFDYHHYHSTAHEALGVAAGRATLRLGGPNGQAIDVTAGDALVLPVGTGHRRITASPDFLVVGAYPAGQEWDICREAPSPEALARIRTLALPEYDPVQGRAGLLCRVWPLKG